MGWILATILRLPALVLVGVLALTAFALSRVVDFRTGEPRLLLDPSVNSMLPTDDPERAYYDRVRRVFGSDESLMVVLAAPDVFSAENLRRIVEMNRRFEEIPGVHHVVSLASALNIRSEGGDLEIGPFVTEVPDDPAALADIRRRALDDPIYTGNLVSRGGDAAGFLIYLREMSEQAYFDSGIEARVAAIAEAERGDGREVWITGGAHVKAEMTRLLLVDLLVLVPLAVAVMGLVAFASFRTLRGVWIPLSTVGVALVWTLGFVAEVAGAFNQVTVAAPPVLIVVGFAYAVHVVSAYYDALREDPERTLSVRELVRASAGHVALPVILTGITTAVGFLSLATSPLSAIQQFGLFTAVGVAANVVAALVYVPAVLALLPRSRVPRARGFDLAFDRFLERLALFDVRHRRPILLAGAALCALALLGMTRILVSTDLVANFRPDSAVRQHFEAVNERLEGSNSFFVVLETDYRDAFKEPVNLREVERLQEWLESQPEIGGTTSLVDYLKVINRGFHEDDPAHLAIPDSKRLVSQLFFFGANDEIESFVDSRYQIVSILVRSTEIDSGRVAALARRIEGHLSKLPERFDGAVTGNTVLVSKTSDDIALGQALSLSTAFVIIYVILALLFTSFRIGFLALIPNALPVLVYFGALGFSGATLNTVTGMVACLVLGIAVDDTIHLMARFNQAARTYADEEKGIIDALKTVGRPVTYTTAALCLGFLVLTSSQLRNQVEFGALASFTLAVAWLADITFTPALAARIRIVTLWDMLTFDLGRDPHKSIPLFAGLRRAQARVAALMMSLRNLAAGERLFTTGEPGDDMYVVIDGELRVTRPGEDGPVELRRLGHGEVVGEVAIFEGKRTADVDAVSDVRLLRLTDRDLRRLQRRYPRIGATLYRNLSRGLADRLASLTERAQ